MDASIFGSSVALTGPWQAMPGDNPAWASSSLNDSRWVVLDPEKPLSSQGFGNAHILWYRLHLHLRPDSPPAAVYIEGLEKNYVLFANGEQLGGQGSMDPADNGGEHPAAAYRLPSRLVAASGGQVVLALRINGGSTGFFNLAPLDPKARVELVHPSQVSYRQSYNLAHSWGAAWVLVGLDLLVGLSGLVIWSSLRDQYEYLALAVWLLSAGLSTVVFFTAHLSAASTWSWSGAVNLVLHGTTLVGELEFVRLLLRRQRSRRWLALEVVAFLLAVIVLLVNTGHLPLLLGGFTYFGQLTLTEVCVGLALIRGILRGNREARLLVLPALLWSFADMSRFLGFALWSFLKIKLPDLPTYHLFSYTIHFATLTDVLGLLSLMLILLRRTVRLSREKADLATEIEAAEELQGLLLARASRPTPGYTVQTVYRPMQEVGGDFFLVQPCEEDDSLVAILGDVSGKGLQAAMRVSMILGVLRRDVMGRPDRVLHILNQALLDQGEVGFTTACCVRLEINGHFTLANAGHLAPYLDRQELEVEAALPLGLDPEAQYSVLTGVMRRGQRLTLLSDGIVEARNRQGELFGFDRTSNLVGAGPDTVASAAENFGQEDDITILSLGLA